MIADVALEPAPTSRRSRRRRPAAITVGEAINDTIAKIGENMTLRRAAALAVEQGRDRPATCTIR